ncbi:hypothetical protein HL033_02360 [Neoehrlichia mikurensis]|uniref:Uncharacterized protein n=1 Tax=Neoehrlichia mikurensis TaxID=89586 RepID=A0A9Q9F3X1_9RICK|nr:hypothetical protein [Neoehrlichia mikurensis]QXK91608.1 hypothetical protein IAH97_02355 [Neoehrlichia mikurensis]QXK92819.1 hypothetical protein HUN61_02350 [Neoehrlichia mikurensis]QXK93298.1 hypothetical protein HL033_02360 [Neoehrlichia mikurensis]UTO55760.1 hypothetical protein LUA82_01630 [Neoehrlichia mikurensis]UTO56677.1 hypothetical protein LUA81_01620 [Neoehrlichia mikurensis]
MGFLRVSTPILSNVIFYDQNYGIFNRGKIVRKVIPLRHKLLELEKQGILSIDRHLSWNNGRTVLRICINNIFFEEDENFFSRVFICEDNNALKAAYNLLQQNLPCRIINIKYKGETIKKYWNAEIILLNAELFDLKNISNLLSDLGEIMCGDANSKVHVVDYYHSSKPLKHRLYDACFYAEKWSLLTLQEKIFRTVFTGIVFLIPPLAFIMLFIYYGSVKDIIESNYLNLRPWQFRECLTKIPQSSYDILFSSNSEMQDLLRKKVICYGSAINYFYKPSLAEGATLKKDCTTLIGKAVSTRDVLLFIAKDNELTKSQLLLRYYLFFGIAIIGCSRIVQLVLNCCLKQENISLYGSLVSYAMLLLGFASLFFIKNKKAKTVSAIGASIVSIISIIALMHVTNNITIPLVYEKWISVLFLSVAALVAGTLLGISNYYKKDKMVASKLNISTTAYLAIKSSLDYSVKQGMGQYDESLYDIKDPLLKEAYKSGIFGDVFKSQVEFNDDEVLTAGTSFIAPHCSEGLRFRANAVGCG